MATNARGFKKSLPITLLHQRNPLLSLQHEFERTVDAFNNMLEISPLSIKSYEELTINPAIDVVEDEKNFKVEIEMPGVGEEDIKVSIDDGLLTVRGEKGTSKLDKDKNYLMREIGYGYYERSIPLPESADITQAKASFRKGMLWVNIPKKAVSSKGTRELKIEKA